MFKKNKKQTETLKEPKEKKVRTVKVGTHKRDFDKMQQYIRESINPKKES